MRAGSSRAKVGRRANNTGYRGGHTLYSGPTLALIFTSVLLVKINNYKKFPSVLFLGKILSLPEFCAVAEDIFYPIQKHLF